MGCWDFGLTLTPCKNPRLALSRQLEALEARLNFAVRNCVPAGAALQRDFGGSGAHLGGGNNDAGHLDEARHVGGLNQKKAKMSQILRKF